MDAAKEIFDSLVTGGYSHIQQLQEEKRIETDLVEFKTIKNDRAPLSPDDISNLSKALCGFANSAGGVIVWGVNCRISNQETGDCVKELRPIANLKRAMSDLMGKGPMVVDPGVSGVIHHPIEEPAGSDTGFIISHVPKGEGLPHQATHEKNFRFYYRSGTSFLAMPQWMVADRFGRRPQPHLKLSWVSGGDGVEDGVMVTHNIRLQITNEGLGTANYPTLVLQRTGLLFEAALYDAGQFYRENLVNPDRMLFTHTRLHPIAPLMSTQVLSATCQPVHKGKDITIDYELSCEGFYEKGVLAITWADRLAPKREPPQGNPKIVTNQVE